MDTLLMQARVGEFWQVHKLWAASRLAPTKVVCLSLLILAACMQRLYIAGNRGHCWALHKDHLGELQAEMRCSAGKMRGDVCISASAGTSVTLWNRLMCQVCTISKD